ncbi:MAG: SRPBCC family protein [Phycisphaerales bacterium]
MRVFTLDVALTLPRPVEQVFAFFADAGNLEAVTPSSLRFLILTPRPIPMHAGAIIDYRLTLSGIRFHWKTLINEWTPPRRFVDTQARGPYRLWHHTHTFDPVEGGTLVRDRVRYAVPLGRPVQRWIVRPKIDAIFRFRQRAVAELILGPSEARTLPEPPAPVHGEER